MPLLFRPGLLKYEGVALILVERRDLQDPDLRGLLDWLDQEGFPAAGSAEFSPAIDILETAEGMKVVADLPGVPADALRVFYTHGLLVIAGQKLPGPCEHPGATFRLAERSFGRFARLFRITGAYDTGRARATLTAGELHVFVPRIEDRRGGRIRIPITTG